MKTRKMTTLKSLREDQLKARAERLAQLQHTPTPVYPMKSYEAEVNSIPYGATKESKTKVVFIEDANGAIWGEVYGTIGLAKEKAAFIVRAVNSHEEMLEALKEAQKVISLAREYFPKSVRHADKFSLENTCATIGSAIAQAEQK